MSPGAPSHPADDGELSAIEQVAADWIIQRDHGLTAAQEAELARWLAADGRHAAVFAALDATWNLMGEAPAASSVAPGREERRQRSVAWIPIGLAAAAAVVFGFFWSSPPAYFSAGSNAMFATSATTKIGGFRTLDMPDGSVVQLNTDSRVDVQFTRAERRVRLSRGEAHFTVAKDSARPFFVTAGDIEMRAVGTAFNVRLHAATVEVLVTEGSVQVAAPDARSEEQGAPRRAGGLELAETEAGRTQGAGPEVLPRPGLRLAAAGEAVAAPPLLTAGQRIVVPLAPRSLVLALPEIAPVEPQAIKQALAWQQRRLDFESMPLPGMVAEINRYNRHKLVIVDSSLEAHRFGGSFPAGDYETFVRLLEANFGVIAERRRGETLLRVGP
jgi:transmembrane sensor